MTSQRWCVAGLLLLVVTTAGCTALSGFDDFTFGDTDSGRGDSGPGDSGADAQTDASSDAAMDARVQDASGDASIDEDAGGGVDAGPDPCVLALAAVCDPNALCSSATGNVVCTCPEGFLDTSLGNATGIACADINECRSASLNECDPDATCINTIGDYECDCNVGFEGNGRVCEDGCVVALSTRCDDNAICTKPTGEAECRCEAGYVDADPLMPGTSCDPDAMCMMLACDPNAACDSSMGLPTCTCPNGYTDVNGDGTLCADVNECDTNNGGCDTNATCTNTDGGFACTCNTGYEGTGTSCADVNECTSGMPVCHQNATCTNDVGSFSCACNAGFSGDGTSCQDDNECLLGTATCASVATCSNIPGSFTCACNSGYTGDGATCSDVNECNTPNTCPMGETCVNSPGSFSCGCPAGYLGTTGMCRDANECMGEGGGSNCSQNATCANTPGSFMCACVSGYTGDGVSCVDVNECTTNNGGCDTTPMATCNNLPGTPNTCSCPDGFEGDGVGNGGCVNVNECMTGQNNCHSTRGTCTDTDGSFTCACRAGYSGNGVTCNDANECIGEGGGNNCHVNATCTNTTGSFTCACSGGYFGTGTACSACTAVSNCAAGLTCTTNANQTCGTCAPGYVGDGSATCTACPSGQRDSNNACVDCGTIANCMAVETCNPADGTALICPTCAPGYRGNGTGVCTPCGTVANCAGGIVCTTSSNQTCGMCSPGYVGDGAATCMACGSGTYDRNNACVACGDIANCTATETCDVTDGSGLTCPTCAASYFGSGTGACTACTAITNCASGLTCTGSSNQTCGTCAAGTVGDGTAVCMPCGTGTYDLNDACVDCGTIANCASVETCNVTNGNSDICPTCAAGYRGNGTGTCTACTAIANCASGLTCTTSGNQTCGTCAPGYVGDGTGSCLPCAAGTYDNNNVCSPCTPIAGCASGLTCTTSSNQTCATCSAGYTGSGTSTCTDINECGFQAAPTTSAMSASQNNNKIQADANPIAMDDTWVRRTSTFSSSYTDEVDACGSEQDTRDAVYRINLTSARTIQFNAVSTGGDALVLAVFPSSVGDPLAGSTVACNANATSIERTLALAAGTYYVVVKAHRKHNPNPCGSFPSGCGGGFISCSTTCTNNMYQDGAFYLEMIDTAKNVNPCDQSPVAACTNNPGRYTCACPGGYSGNGEGASGCVDINECALNTDGCDTAPEACVNTTGGFNCTCPSGSTGMGVGANGCVGCGDGTLASGEEYDPPPGPFSTAVVNSTTCHYNFSSLTQLYCNGTCTWNGGSGCDQYEADAFCKLRNDNRFARATAFTTGNGVPGSPGFTCPGSGTSVGDMTSRGVPGTVQYTDAFDSGHTGTSILSATCDTGGTFTFTNTAADDVAASALTDWFTAMAPLPTDYIFVEIVGGTATGPGAWCGTRADWYRTEYLARVAAGTSVSSGTWDKYYRVGTGAWSAVQNTAHTNYFGAGCSGSAPNGAWCSEWALGGLYLGALPSHTTHSSELYAGNFNTDASTLTIRMGATRAAACGF